MNAESRVSFLDPCAGDGEAILSLMKLWCKSQKRSSDKLYGCEMESSRFEALKLATEHFDYGSRNDLVHGDAFCVTFERTTGVSLLYLNPPYDVDKVHGRLENKFLVRFTPALTHSGILLFVVPFYALQASAQEFGQHYQNLHCFKFPESDFGTFKQVVLFAQRTETRLQPNAEIVAQVERWARGEGLRELPRATAKPLVSLPEQEPYGEPLQGWKLREVDLAGLVKKAKPWVQAGRNGSPLQVPGILPELPINEIMLRRYPVATPPRPAHIASGIAAGIFNGSQVTADKRGLPPLLVKGVFNQEYRTVEEKTDKHGRVTALVQVQQPSLTVTVLDLTTYRYHTLPNTGEFSKRDISTLPVSGLLEHYGTSLMGVMEQQCPILYDPRRDRSRVKLARTGRKLFEAQQDATKALVTLLGGSSASRKQRRGKAAILLGEIGSGKTTVALAVAATIQAKRPLVMCPPHLLQGWSDEIAKVLPEAEIRILTDVHELQAVANDQSERMIVSVISRETAKLGHGWVGVGAVCPKCGAPVPHDPDAQAKKRLRCEHQPLCGHNPVSKATLGLLHYLKRYAPQNETIAGILRQRWDVRSRQWYTTHPQKYRGLPKYSLDHVVEQLTADCFKSGGSEAIYKAISWCLVASNSQELIHNTASQFLERPEYGHEEFGRLLLCLLPPGSKLQTATAAEQRSKQDNKHSYWNPWSEFEKTIEAAQRGAQHVRIQDLQISWQSGKLSLGGAEAESLEAACNAALALTRCSDLHWGPECGEFLFQAVPEPRRTALAKHILDHYPQTFDFLVVDECHEVSNEGAAQQKAAHRLVGLGLPTILMTGSLMNGYAESLFMNMWAVSPEFRQEFSRDDKQRFIDRYGYRKRIVTNRDDDDQVVAFGAVSDRVTTTERVIGNAPGVLPLFLLRHLLPVSVTLHKQDLALDLPRCHQERHFVDPGPKLKARYDKLKRALVERIRRDRFDPELAGKLFGQLAELPSYLDRATRDTGNSKSGHYSVCYPESVGGDVVVTQEGLPASEVLPKEQWMIDRVLQELQEGRNVMVFSWHVSLLPRLAGLISEAIGEKVPILYADKVGTAKRQDWINKNVVQKKARVLVTNPVAIQTGLNNLVHFSTEIWLENPMCNPIVYRQATGRVDRIGQTRETRILFPVYRDTLQEQLHELLLHKVTVSTATDGLDPESTLLASGAGPDEYMTGLSIGKQLWAMLSKELAA